MAQEGRTVYGHFLLHLHERRKNGAAQSGSRKVVATCRSTEGVATPVGKVCPGCGYVHTATESAFCPSCRQRIYSCTIFGQVMTGNTVEYQGKTYPSLLFKKKRPIPSMRLYLQVNKLYNE